MKRIGILAVAVALILTISACGCNSSPSSMPNNVTPAPASSNETLGEMIDDVLPDMDYSLLRTGLGIVSSTADSEGAAPALEGIAKFEVTVCALSMKEDGTIIDIKFDSVEGDTRFDNTGKFSSDLTAEYPTKKELGDAYGMREASGIGKEWYEQMASLEDWMRGKMVTDVLAMKVTDKEGDVGKKLVDEPDLKTSVTISVTDHLRALDKAYSDAMK